MPHPPAVAAWPWHRRLHAALMPDYGARAARLWWSTVVLGAAALGWSLVEVAAMPATAWLQVLAGMALAMGAGLFPVRIPGSKNSFVAGEIFIFLLLLLLGPAAATVAAAGEAAMGAWRSSRRWTSRLFSPAAAAIAMLLSGSLLQAVLDRLQASGGVGAAGLLGAASVFAVLYFLVGAQLVSGVARLKRGERFFHAHDLISVFRWVGMAYVGSASVAALLYFTYRQTGVGVLLTMLPLLAMLLVTLHFYFREQEAGLALRERSAEVAAREASMAARESEAAARHLQELQASERRFHAAFTHASIGMALMQFDGGILQVNQALAALLGREVDGLVQHRLQEFVLAEDRAMLDERLGLVDQREFEGFTQELRCIHADGSVVWALVHCSFFTEPGAGAPCLIAQAQDVTARRQAEAGLQHMAYHDSLTGLANRRRFNECLAGAVARAKVDAAHSFAVIFIDFDRFKLVNDSLGHSAGDDLLVQMARRIQERLRPNDILARLGGDEFAILADRVDNEQYAVPLAERLMEALRHPLQVAGAEIIPSASLGITFSAFGYDSAEEVLRDADTAMYKAKSSGKSRYALFDATLHQAVSGRLRLEGELHHAIEQGQLEVVYQPVFELAGGQLRGFEALVRWNHPHDGTLAPPSFLQIAQESGLMLSLSDFVLHCACQQLREWQRLDPALAELSMSVNISADDLSQPTLVARVSRAIIEAGLRPQHLMLELTESILMARIDGALATLSELRRLGVHLAVDDFGTGYSSLSHLATLPFDTLKIDRSFVHGLRPEGHEASIVRAIVQLGGTLHKAIVAEGIETAAQARQLCEMGCEMGQGFHLSLPLSGPDAGELLRRRLGPAPALA